LTRYPFVCCARGTAIAAGNRTRVRDNEVGCHDACATIATIATVAIKKIVTLPCASTPAGASRNSMPIQQDV
jgi:hypothetical protein